MKQKDFVILFGSIAVVVILWIGFTLYNKSVTTSLDPTLISDVKPIDGKFDQETLTAIKNRQSVTPLYSLTGAVSGTPTPQPASSSATVTLLPTPTPTGVTRAVSPGVLP